MDEDDARPADGPGRLARVQAPLAGAPAGSGRGRARESSDA